MRKIINSTGNAKTRDPFVLKYNGLFYHCFSGDGKSISISCFSNIEDIGTADSKIVYIPDRDEYGKELWAPELHIINNRCYIYVACDDGNNYNHRMYVLENESSNPMDEYKMHGKITDSTDKWAIDGNLINYKGELYYFWSGWEGDRNVRQNIYVAKMKDPYSLSSERVLISSAIYDWEKIGSTPEDTEGKPYINEGPFAFVYDQELYVAYSASGSWSEGYCIAFLKLIGDDLLDNKSWYKYEKPTLSSNDILFGAGHCSIFMDDGRYYVVFHAWSNDVKEIVWHTVSSWVGELVLIDNEFKIK